MKERASRLGLRALRTATSALAATALVAHPAGAEVDPLTGEWVEPPPGPRTFEKSGPEEPEQPDTRSGFRLELRTGFGFVAGKAQAAASRDLSGLVLGQVPVWIDAGGAVSKKWTLSAYFSYGIGILSRTLARACELDERAFPASDVNCKATSVRAGVSLAYHARPNKSLDPWVATSTGYEWLTVGESIRYMGEHATLNLYADGLEGPTVSGGVDFRLSSLIALGPFFSFALGRYLHAGLECSGSCEGFTTQSDNVDRTSLHVWIFAGVKGALTP